MQFARRRVQGSRPRVGAFGFGESFPPEKEITVRPVEADLIPMDVLGGPVPVECIGQFLGLR